MRALPAVAVAALLVLAGCSGGVPDVDPGPGPGGQTTTASEPASPPGVTDGELTDPGLLVREHVESVRERGARVQSNATATVQADNDARTVSFGSVAWATAGGDRVYYRSNRLVGALSESTQRERVYGYANETTVVERGVVDGNETVSVAARDGSQDLVAQHIARTRFLRRVLAAGTFEVAGTERQAGRTVTTLVADDRSLDDDGRSVFQATVVVTDDGRVLSLSVRRNPDANTDVGRRTYEATWTAPPTDPETPDWVP